MLTKKEMSILKKSVNLIGKPSGLFDNNELVISVTDMAALLDEFLEEEKKAPAITYRSNMSFDGDGK